MTQSSASLVHQILSQRAQQHFLWASDLHHVVRRQQMNKFAMVDRNRYILSSIRVWQTGPGDLWSASANLRERERVAARLPLRPGFP